MIDLHCHSNKSDGEFSPSDLLIKAEQLGLTYFSITDHNNCFAYENLDTSFYNGTLICGVEITTSFENQIIEILGYGMDFKEINSWCSNERKKEPEYAKIVYKKLIETFENNNIYYTKELDIYNQIDNTWTTGMVKKTLYDDLLKYPENLSIIGKDVLISYSNFNKLGLNNPNSIIFINEYSRFLSLEEAVNMIHKNGGLCFIAHVYQYDVENHIEFIDKIRNIVHIDGVEIIHSSFTSEQIREITQYADSNNLFKCGGSDFHGELKPGFKLGLDLKISDDIIKPWINKVL